jgi:hypothetical protein
MSENVDEPYVGLTGDGFLNLSTYDNSADRLVTYVTIYRLRYLQHTAA